MERKDRRAACNKMQPRKEKEKIRKRRTLINPLVNVGVNFRRADHRLGRNTKVIKATTSDAVGIAYTADI